MYVCVCAYIKGQGGGLNVRNGRMKEDSWEGEPHTYPGLIIHPITILRDKFSVGFHITLCRPSIEYTTLRDTEEEGEKKGGTFIVDVLVGSNQRIYGGIDRKATEPVFGRLSI